MTLDPSRGTTDSRDRDLARGLADGLGFTCIVEAGAGTGKTTVLVDRLLSVVAAGTSASRIAAITFTEKAAGELRVRFRAGLEEALGRASDEERPALETALRELDRAHIGTIHSFCGGLLRERPVEAGVDPDFAVADELRRSVLLETAWDRWIRAELAEGLPQPLGDATALGAKLSDVRELAFSLIERRDAVRFIPGTTPETAADDLISALQTEAESFLRAAIEHCSDPDDIARRLIEWFAAEADALEFVPEESRTAYAFKGVKVEPPVNRGNKKNWDYEVLKDLRARAKTLKEKQAEVRRGATHNATVGLLSWLEGFLEEYEREKASSGYLDFDDLLSKARDLLKDDPDTRRYFKRAYDRILVDEFQDTDPLQCEIVFFLSETIDGAAGEWDEVELEPGKLFLVGDPKQSIYRFRRADIEMYERAKELVAGSGRVLTLTENFRTRPAVVDCVNSVFEAEMVPPEGELRYQPDYVPLVAHRSADEEGPGLVILEPGPERPKPTSKSGKLKAEELRTEEATAVASYLRHILDEGRTCVYDRASGSWRPPRLGDVALLFHKSTALEQYEDALDSYGIDYRIAGGKRFYVRREVRELKTVLAAIDDPNDLVSVLGALRTPFFGVSDEDIAIHDHRTGGLRYLADDGGVPAVDEAFRLLRELHFERNSRTVEELIAKLFDATSALELYLLKPTGEQRHANLLKVQEMAAALEKQEPMSFGGFVRWLEDISRLTPEEAESPLAEEGDDFLRVMTIHKSKGLEFPIVVLADLAQHQLRSDNLIVDREEGRLEYAKSSLETLGYADAKELEKERAAAEIVRLLYVGATRARDRVVVPWFADKPEKPSGLLKPFAGIAEHGRVERFDSGVLDLSAPGVKPVRLRLDDAMAADPEETDASRDLKAWSERLAGFAETHDRPPRVITPSSIGHERGAPRPLRGGDEDESVDDALRRDGTRLGTLLHRVMERAPLDAPEGLPEAVRAVARAEGADDELTERALRMAEAAVGSEVVRRAVASDGFDREVPFCVSRDGVTVEGKVDLLFREGGELAIVDYKTDAEPEGGFEALVERYRGQALAYSVAAEAATGLDVRTVVLLFLSGSEPKEIRVPLDGTREERWRELERLAPI